MTSEPVPSLLVGADDRTGALEVAGELAARARAPVLVATGPVGPTVADRVVVDLGTRHRAAVAAAAAAAALDRVGAARHAHKIDSLLRGNWAAELVARSRRRPVVVVPALPALGRVCVGGLVVARDARGERPVHELAVGDARRAATSSRPADGLRAAGAASVVELAGAGGLAGWLERVGPGGLAVVDAATDADLVAIGATLPAARDVVVAGPAGAVATVTLPFGPEPAARSGPRLRAERGLAVLVVVGSLHDAARAQLSHLRETRPGAAVATTPMVAGPVSPAAAEAVAAGLARQVTAALATGRFGAVVVVGGDTAAAVLGPAPVWVDGLLAPGTPIARRVDGAGPLVVTRAGSFGGDDALVELYDLLSER